MFCITIHVIHPLYTCMLDGEEERESVSKAVSSIWLFLPPENLPGFVFEAQSQFIWVFVDGLWYVRAGRWGSPCQGTAAAGAALGGPCPHGPAGARQGLLLFGQWT